MWGLMRPSRKSHGPKKADVAEHLEVFDHVGLLFNEPPGIHRAALHLVIRRLRSNILFVAAVNVQKLPNTPIIVRFGPDAASGLWQYSCASGIDWDEKYGSHASSAATASDCSCPMRVWLIDSTIS
jgi:hypothetical protein